MARRQLGTAPSNAADTATKGYVDTATTNMVTTTGTQSLSNKTISGASNTVTNLPASATPDAARLVVTTQVGSDVVGSESGWDTWAKILTWTPGTSNNVDLSLMLAFVSSVNTGFSDQAIVSVFFRQNTSSVAGNVDVHMIAKAGVSGGQIDADSFKVVSNGYNTTYELWVRKGGAYNRFDVYELANGGVTSALSYSVNPAWQLAEPTGTLSKTTNGVTVFDVPVVTTTATQTLENKRLASASVPSTATSTGTTGQIAYDSSHLYICTATNTWRRVAIASW